MLATAGKSQYIKFWSTQTGQLIDTIHIGECYDGAIIAYSRNSNIVAIAKAGSFRITLWNIKTKNNICSIHTQYEIEAFEFGENDKTLYIATAWIPHYEDSGESFMSIYNLYTYKYKKKTISIKNKMICSIAMNPNAGLAIYSTDGIELWDHNLSRTEILEGYDTNQCVGYLTSKYLISSDISLNNINSPNENHGFVALWDTKTNGKYCISKLRHGGSVSVAPIGNKIALGYSGGMVKIWDYKLTGKSQ